MRMLNEEASTSTQDRTVGMACEYLYAGDADLEVGRGPLAGRIRGDDQPDDLHFFNVDLIWRL